MEFTEAYELFVGQITVQEFLAPFNGDVDQAIAQLMEEAWWTTEDCQAPDNLPDLIRQYVEHYGI